MKYSCKNIQNLPIVTFYSWLNANLYISNRVVFTKNSTIKPDCTQEIGKLWMTLPKFAIISSIGERKGDANVKLSLKSIFDVLNKTSLMACSIFFNIFAQTF